MVEKERWELYDKVKLLEERINKEKEQLDMKTMGKLDRDEEGLSDMSYESYEEDDSNDSSNDTSQWMIKLKIQKQN